MSDDDFTPRLGRGASTDGRRTTRYLNRVIMAARLAGAATGVRARRFDGSRIGRGAGIGRLLSSRDRLAGQRGRRAVVKTRLVRLGGKGAGAARAHLRYIQREGVTREGAPGELYAAEHDVADGPAFLERCAGDRHQFRFIVSAEDGAEYDDLKPFIRRLMTQAEHDLGTRLDWVAADHFNTGHPHTHVLLRGVDDRGDNLVIAREYIAHGLRERAAELVTLDLGPRTDLEIEARLRRDVDRERLTATDRRLLRRMDAARIVLPEAGDPVQHALAVGRLRKLQSLGLAEDVGGGRYRLADGLADTLTRIGERGDIIRLMQRELTARRLDRAGGDQVIADGSDQPVVGRVIHRGLTDDRRDTHFLIVDGLDGRAHYVGIGTVDQVEPLTEGAIVRVTPRVAAAREADRTVAAIADGNDGRYSVALHLRHDPGAGEAFVEAHVRRLEALRRGGAGMERAPDGTWRIAPDHIERATDFERRQLRDRPVDVATLSPLPLERLAQANAATWLDRELASDLPLPLRDAGFGRETRAALAIRRAWLVEQQLAEGEGAAFRLRPHALADLQRRELLRVSGELSEALGKSFVEAKSGAPLAGRLARRVDLASGRFALVEQSREFTLVPWRPVLERQLGKQVGGIVRGDGVNWSFGRGRGGPEIS